MEKVKNLIVGCGLSGVVVARKLAEQGEPVVIIDKRSHIGGNLYDYKEESITVHKYGPHVFHTNSSEVWQFLSRFTKWHRFMYRVKAFIDGEEVNVPFNLDSLKQVFPKDMAKRLSEKLIEKYGFNKKVPILELKESRDLDLEFLARYVYDKVFAGYTSKQWGIPLEELDESVGARVPVYISRDNRYFQDKYQGIPANGYTKMIENLLQHPLIEVRLNTDWKNVREDFEYERLIYTGAIDEFFNYELGKLPYRSLDIVFEKYDTEYFQSGPQINFPENYDYTRSVEYKYYLDEKSDKTIVSFEYPESFEEGKNERYYPIPTDENQKRYDAYLEKARALENVFFLGRLGDYKYYNMDETVRRALSFFEKEVKNGK